MVMKLVMTCKVGKGGLIMNLNLMNINNQNKKECQPLRNNMGVQPLRGKVSKNTSFASSSPGSNTVSQKDYAELQAKYDLACRIIASQRLEAQKNQQSNKSLNYLA